jgi:hypothetical protein
MPVLICDEQCNHTKQRRAIILPKSRHERLTLVPAITRPTSPLFSANDNLSARLVFCIERLCLGYHWLTFVPARIGSDPAIDSAAAALCYAHHHVAHDGLDPAGLNLALRAYGQTIQRLQRMLNNPETATSEAALTAVGMLQAFEVMMPAARHGKVNISSHQHGMTAILLARPAESRATDIARGILYCDYNVAHTMYMIQGIASPYDTKEWLDMEALKVDHLPAAGRRLQRVWYQLGIRLPRLVQYVNALRGPKSDDETRERAASLAKELLDLHDTAAETDFLKGHVKIVPNEDMHGKVLVPHMFQYNSPKEFRPAVLYWAFRLVTIHLAKEITTLLQADALESFDNVELEALQARQISNLLMSWQYAQPHGMWLTCDLFMGYCYTWACIKKQTEFRGRQVQELRWWLLPKLRHPFAQWTQHVSEAMVDVATSMMLGSGPVP